MAGDVDEITRTTATKTLTIIFIIAIVLVSLCPIITLLRRHGLAVTLNVPRLLVLTLTFGGIIVALFPLVIKARLLFDFEAHFKAACDIPVLATVYESFYYPFVYASGMIFMAMYYIAKEKVKLFRNVSPFVCILLVICPWLLGLIIVLPLMMSGIHWEHGCHSAFSKSHLLAQIWICLLIPVVAVVCAGIAVLLCIKSGRKSSSSSPSSTSPPPSRPTSRPASAITPSLSPSPSNLSSLTRRDVNVLNTNSCNNNATNRSSDPADVSYQLRHLHGSQTEISTSPTTRMCTSTSTGNLRRVGSRDRATHNSTVNPNLINSSVYPNSNPNVNSSWNGIHGMEHSPTGTPGSNPNLSMAYGRLRSTATMPNTTISAITNSPSSCSLPPSAHDPERPPSIISMSSHPLFNSQRYSQHQPSHHHHHHHQQKHYEYQHQQPLPPYTMYDFNPQFSVHTQPYLSGSNHNLQHSQQQQPQQHHHHNDNLHYQQHQSQHHQSQRPTSFYNSYKNNNGNSLSNMSNNNNMIPPTPISNYYEDVSPLPPPLPANPPPPFSLHQRMSRPSSCSSSSTPVLPPPPQFQTHPPSHQQSATRRHRNSLDDKHNRTVFLRAVVIFFFCSFANPIFNLGYFLNEDRSRMHTETVKIFIDFIYWFSVVRWVLLPFNWWFLK